jgi:hypothetical protein
MLHTSGFVCIRWAECVNGLFSNYGTYPRWSPYKTHAVQENITFRQNNLSGATTPTSGTCCSWYKRRGTKLTGTSGERRRIIRTPLAPHVDARC